MAAAMDCAGVMEHLMFQKALIDDADPDRERRIEGYVQTVEGMQRGGSAASEDPFERSIALTFELVVQQKFDPWDINLVEFSKMYLARVRKASDINFIIAGKLVYMAWEILKLQSEQVLRRVDRPEQVELMFEGWNPDDLGLFVDPFELGVGESLLHADEMPIGESVRRRSERPVTLIDLLDAFDEAKKEADIREELSRFMKKYRRPDFDDKAHKENLEEDIATVWERLQEFGHGPIPLADLYLGGKEDRITVFISALFLAKMGKVSLWQKKPPFGEIFLEVKVAWDIAQLEDASLKAPEGETTYAAQSAMVAK